MSLSTYGKYGGCYVSTRGWGGVLRTGPFRLYGHYSFPTYSQTSRRLSAARNALPPPRSAGLLPAADEFVDVFEEDPPESLGDKKALSARSEKRHRRGRRPSRLERACCLIVWQRLKRMPRTGEVKNAESFFLKHTSPGGAVEVKVSGLHPTRRAPIRSVVVHHPRVGKPLVYVTYVP
ncbi:MAG: hypothetical protein HYU36_11140 [Planctomycetes bacterium]|nr:hypothetical protein [Planctomycetota bacterium]